MFFPQEMTKIRMIIPSRDLLTVTKDLAEQGVFHQESGNHVIPGKPIPTNNWQERAAAYSALERRILTVMAALNIPVNEVSIKEPDKMLDISTASAVVDEIEKIVKQSRDEISKEQKQEEQLRGYLEQIDPIQNLDVDLDSLRQPRYLFSMLGVIPVGNIPRLQTSLAKTPHVLVPLRQDNQRAIIWLSGPKQNADVLDRAARSAYLNPLNLPEVYQGTPKQIIESMRSDIHQIEQKIAEQDNILKQLRSEWQARLESLLGEVQASRILAEAIGRFGQYRYTYVINGWVPSDKVSKFNQDVKQKSPDILVEAFPTKRGAHEQNIPVELRNPSIIRYFQSFVMNYARPLYEEIDPTWLLALTFPILFGAMFGDVGQGAVLALVGILIASGRIKQLRSMASLGGIIAVCGFFAMIFGVLYGSVFGFEEILPAILFHPISNILTAMIFAISVGVVLLSVGYVINILNSFTTRNWGKFLFDPHGLAGLLLYWSLIGLVVEGISGKHPIPMVILAILAVLSVVGTMFSEALQHMVNHHKPLFEGGAGMYGVQSFFEMFEVLISMLSNSVSFVRVGAFAVAHAGLTVVFFIMAKLISPGQGIGYWIVVAFGNLFILGFEGLIVGIQTMRLEYYEFFSKFFSGGGVQYQPLTFSPKLEK
jgi:V/A-type H+-transporting ATPase subunit I